MRRIPLLLLPAVAIVLSGCATFDSAWQDSIADYRAGKVKAPEGPWTGEWNTTTNDHEGDLRAIVTKADDGEYDFRYRATWANFLKAGYKVSFPVTRTGSTYKVDGDHKLGMFGTFRHRATITESKFDASYANEEGDIGVFTMRRPE